MKMLYELKLFVAAINYGNLSAAGREFYLSPASISNKINALEEYYQTKLLIRTTRKIEPTKAGEKLYITAIKLLEQLENLQEDIQNNENTAEGIIKITIPFDLGKQIILPILDEFKEKNPNIQYDINLTDDVISYNQFPFDIAIRYGNLPDSNFIAKKLVDNYRMLCASPEYLQKMNISNINNINMLDNYDFITLKINSNTIKKLYLIDQENNKYEVNIKPSYIVNNGYISRQMCINGNGISEKSYWDVKQNLESGTLVQVLPKYRVTLNKNDKPENMISIVHPSKQFQPYRIRMLSEFIVNSFSKLKS
ncbi:LysR substrate-binding domain-containing protein [Francisella salimarina]|uniref:LysR family transcriptional regulator n=1 Tax=Francisella salimarina TaxID=2599927 RepID=UPI003D8152E8